MSLPHERRRIPGPFATPSIEVRSGHAAGLVGDQARCQVAERSPGRGLVEHRIVRVPVTDKGKLVGIIARRDLIRALIEPEFMVFRETL